MKLTSTNVEAICLACLFKDDEPVENAVMVHGVQLKIGFNPNRLKENEAGIISLLEQLPDQFKKTVGGGWTFLNLCTDKDGTLWTGVHHVCDQLICLGIAIGKVSFTLPRAYWNALPGGMPYVTIDELN